MIRAPAYPLAQEGPVFEEAVRRFWTVLFWAVMALAALCSVYHAVCSGGATQEVVMHSDEAYKMRVDNALDHLAHLPEDGEARSRRISSVARTLREELPMVTDERFRHQAEREFRKAVGEDYRAW